MSHLLAATPFASQADASTWPALIDQVGTCYSNAIAEWRATYESLLEDWRQADDSSGNARRRANALRYQAMAFHERTVIEALADEQFLPRYGFPIGLLRLRVLTVTESDKPDAKPYVREEDQYRLERPGLLAMREYVPGASFFVGNKVVTSHGLLKHWTGANLNTAIGFPVRWPSASTVIGSTPLTRTSAPAPSAVPPSESENRNRCSSHFRSAERPDYSSPSERPNRNSCSSRASASARPLGIARSFAAHLRHRSASSECETITAGELSLSEAIRKLHLPHLFRSEYFGCHGYGFAWPCLRYDKSTATQSRNRGTLKTSRFFPDSL